MAQAIDEERTRTVDPPQPGFPAHLRHTPRPFSITDNDPRGKARFFERTIGLVAVALLTFACFQIVAPFIIPMLWGAIIAVSTWPLYKRLNAMLGDRPALAATLMTLLMFVVLVTPVVFLVGSLTDSVIALGDAARGLTRAGMSRPPAWLADLPAVGSLIDRIWQQAASNMSAFFAQIQPALGVVTAWLLQRLGDIGIAVIEFLVAVLIAGIMYVTGKPGLDVLRKLVRRIGGDQQVALVELAGRTIRGVAQSVIGTAFVQAIAAAFGFWVAGAPGVALLALATFMLALVQIPTATVWAPVAAWLFWQGEIVWGAFMALWGFFIVNTVDNVIRPYLISQGARLPFLLMFVGVVGGLLAYGFIGIFIGATLLAVSYTLILDWLEESASADGAPGGDRPASGAGDA